MDRDEGAGKGPQPALRNRQRLVRDIEHYLADEPVQACPPSAAYRLRKLARRHKVALATSGIVAASLILCSVISAWQAHGCARAEGLAQERLIAETEARQQATAEAAKAIAIEFIAPKGTPVGQSRC